MRCMQDTCYVTFTMDCETIDVESPTGGPEDWDLARRAIVGYAEALRARGHCVTTFCVPRVAEVLAEALRDLTAEDVEIGMHYHPQTTDCGYDCYLGECSAEQQHGMLGDGMTRVAEAVGEQPRSFRPGNFSANDETLGVLADLGFRQGSVSLPGRVRPDFAAMWGDAPFFPHRASASDRNQIGDLDFWEFPVCADLKRAHCGDELGDNLHLRIEARGFVEWSGDLLDRYVAAMVEADWQPKAVVVMTHNTQYYDDPGNPAREALELTCDRLEETLAHHRLAMQPATLAQIIGR
jgi:hypothetical protein